MQYIIIIIIVYWNFSLEEGGTSFLGNGANHLRLIGAASRNTAIWIAAVNTSKHSVAVHFFLSSIGLQSTCNNLACLSVNQSVSQ